VTFQPRIEPVADQPAEHQDLAEIRAGKLQQIAALGIDPWGQRFDGHMPIAQIRELPANGFSDTDPPGPKVRAAGRVVRHRTGGKLQFLELQDQTGRVQIMVRINKVSERDWKVLNLLDLGDVIGIDGEFGKTKTGELTIQATTLTFLTKSLEPHPKDVFGLADVETRLRQKYLDLIYNPDALKRAHQRVKIVRTMRNYLDERGYLEVETPVLQSVASGAAARPFNTHHNALDLPLVLRIALELPLKRLLVGGIEKVYEIGRVFRNEGISLKHNPEFTMLELYHAYGDLYTIMDLVEGLLTACVDALGNGRPVDGSSLGASSVAARTLPWGEKSVTFEPPFQRAKFGDLFKEHVGADMMDKAGVKEKAAAFKVPLTIKDEKTGKPIEKEHDVLVNDLFGEVVEPKLTGPVFVYDYPAELCPLTKRKPSEPHIAERFELYVHGMELANAYTELNDPDTQAKTFQKQLAGQSEEDSMAKMDDDFIRALRHGMPPAGGLGIGIDRLVMLLTNTPTIRDVILFPLLRPEGRVQ
jgi:lysyl-tRNA synthetase class 2